MANELLIQKIKTKKLKIKFYEEYNKRYTNINETIKYNFCNHYLRDDNCPCNLDYATNLDKIKIADLKNHHIIPNYVLDLVFTDTDIYKRLLKLFEIKRNDFNKYFQESLNYDIYNSKYKITCLISLQNTLLICSNLHDSVHRLKDTNTYDNYSNKPDDYPNLTRFINIFLKNEYLGNDLLLVFKVLKGFSKNCDHKILKEVQKLEIKEESKNLTLRNLIFMLFYMYCCDSNTENKRDDVLANKQKFIENFNLDKFKP